MKLLFLALFGMVAAATAEVITSQKAPPQPGADGQPCSLVEVQKASEHLLKYLSEQNSGDELTKVITVTKQLVAGYIFTVTYGVKNSRTNTPKVCSMRIWNKLDRTTEVLENTCSIIY